jgi:endo-1,4-beta-xylanase
MKDFFKALMDAIRSLFGLSVQPAPTKDEQVIIPTEPPIVVEPPKPNPVLEPEQLEPVTEVKPEPKPVEQPKPEPVIIPITPKPEPKPDSLPPAANLTLKQSPIKWGLAMKEAHLKDKEIIEEAFKHFGSLSGENSFKPGHIQKKEGVFDFSNAKALVKIAKAKGMRVHGHACFVWPSQQSKLPKFWHEAAKDKKKYIALLKNSVQTVVREFKEDVFAWDIVNEAHEDDGSLRPCYALTHMGPSYIEQIAGWVKEVQHTAQRFISDYDFETSSNKAAVVIEYAGSLKKKGIIEGISSQMHIRLKMKYDTYVERLQRMAKAGLLVHLSELDVVATPAQEKEKAEKYKEVVKGFRTLPGSLQYGITVWSFQDDWNFMNYQKDPKPFAPAIFSKGYKGGLTLPAILSVK